jgi:hypothetical protein
MSDLEMTKHDHVLAGLMFSLQAAAMQQMGKIQDPVSGDASVNLDQAKATIDVLEMLKAKCRTDTPADLLHALDGAVMDLQLNYMDEVKKNGQAAETPVSEEESAGKETAAAEGENEKAGDEG